MYLYKYREMNARNLLSLRKREIWYSVGRNFNDPFDCTLNVPVNLMSGSSMLSFIHKNTSAKKLLDTKLITTEQIELTALNYIVQAQQLVNSGRINEHPLSPIIDILFAFL